MWENQLVSYMIPADRNAFFIKCPPGRNRTFNLILKRDLLCQLSYGRDILFSIHVSPGRIELPVFGFGGRCFIR